MDKTLERIIKLRDQVLKKLSGKTEGFFLAGGTALSTFYFHHRESFDLDFFSKSFSEKRVIDIIAKLSKSMGLKIDIIEKSIAKNEAKMIVCYVPDNGKESLKVDFVEDVYREVESQSIVVNGVHVMSKENIYLRKIYAVFGVFKTEDEAGRKKFLGGRKEAKDFFDLFYLSQTFMPLAVFMDRHCTLDEKESAIRWHQTHDRLLLKSELLDIVTDKAIDCRIMEKHFDAEIENIIKQIIE